MIRINTSSFGKFDPAPTSLLRERFDAVEMNPYGRKLTKDEVIALCAGAEAVIAGTEVFDAEVLEACKALKIISRCGIGIDNIDMETARARGIAVYRSAEGPAQAVAELTLGLLLDLVRGISAHHADMQAGTWKKRMGRLLSGMRVAVLGYGNIGSKVARLLRAFDCQVAVCDPCRMSAEDGFTDASLEDLLPWAEAITLHASCSMQILGPRQLDRMRDGALIVNMARGELLDETALLERLTSGKLGGAALDSFQQEPYAGPLRDLPNVILTPHIGSYALESRVAMEAEAVQNLITGMEAHRCAQ